MEGNGDNVSLLVASFGIASNEFVCLANMQVITAIYLNCRPDLRDEWLTGNEVDDQLEAQVGLFLLLTFARIY